MAEWMIGRNEAAGRNTGFGNQTPKEDATDNVLHDNVKLGRWVVVASIRPTERGWPRR
jgi:hypothetical protein